MLTNPAKHPIFYSIAKAKITVVFTNAFHSLILASLLALLVILADVGLVALGHIKLN